eukprot:gnl/TRDRNA2_/TRDRNA2_173618_c1_seq10.p1 gnl/TRDRNA2_/TRDRNA2_173618_c1~~gnl/TRDRNA2_/TRDRNA2_173618_c1_seq10.p1  ORF type:complete len:171 (-),score=3.03 gnl/TRDRNA2_/TRDRNA2_173618_c1_seq10:899-1411(-)
MQVLLGGSCKDTQIEVGCYGYSSVVLRNDALILLTYVLMVAVHSGHSHSGWSVLDSITFERVFNRIKLSPASFCLFSLLLLFLSFLLFAPPLSSVLPLQWDAADFWIHGPLIDMLSLKPRLTTSGRHLEPHGLQDSLIISDGLPLTHCLCVLELSIFLHVGSSALSMGCK